MNLNSFLVKWAFLSLVIFGSSNALGNRNNLNTLPTIQVERRSSSWPPISIYSKSQSYDQLSVFPPLRFEGESTIFLKTLKNEDFGGYRSSGRLDVNLRLTCEAPYITKWVFNSHFEDEAEREKRMSPFNYSVRAFPRPNESPFSDHRSEGFELYNLTELMIHSVGNSLKSASMDCVSVLNESIKSSFNIFQRFRDQSRSLDIITSMQTAESTFVVPCRVNDPDATPGLQRSFDYKFIIGTFLKYNWKSGFRRVNDEPFNTKFEYSCTYGSRARRVYQKYKFEQPQERILIQQFKNALVLKINQDMNDLTELDTFTIEATLENHQVNDPFGINSIQISECISPHYCVSDGRVEVRCTDPRICLAPFPPHTEGHKVNKIRTEGTVVTYGNINGALNPKARVSDAYFTGLSGKMYLTSQSVLPNELIQVNIELSPDSRNIIVSCRAVTFLTFDPIRFSKTLRGGTKSLLDDEYSLSTSTDQRSSEPDFLRRKSSSVEIMDVCDVQLFSCHALWFNSTQWMEDTVHLNEQGLFPIQKAVRETCTVTRRPATKRPLRPSQPIPEAPTTTPGSTKTVVPWNNETNSCHPLWLNSTRFIEESANFSDDALSGLFQCSPQEKIAHLDVKSYKGTRAATVSCKATKCLTQPNIQIAIKYVNGTQIALTSDDSGDNIVRMLGSHVFISTQTQEKRVNLSVANANKIEAITCQIPLFNSTQSIQVTLNFTSSNEETNTGPLFQLCNYELPGATSAYHYTYSSKWNGHDSELFLVYCDSHVVLYSDKYLNSSIIENIKVVSDAWRYAKSKYGFLHSDLTLNVITTDKREACKTSRMKSYDDQTYKNLAVIECGSLIGNWSTPSLMYTIVNQIGHLTLRMADAPGYWPASKVSSWEMADILAYDILMGIGRSRKAKEWKEFKMNDATAVPEENTYWFRDWYFPIYSKYGQSRVLNQFMNLLREHWQIRKRKYDYSEPLKLEEFVHFWSGAAGVNLKSVANTTFNWNDLNDKKLRHAQENYPEITYDGSSQPIKAGADALIIGISCGFVCLMLAAIVCFITIYRRNMQRLKKQFRELTNEEIQLFFDGNLNGDSTKPGYDFIESQPFNKEYEIPRDRLNILYDQVLGSGEFGLVYRGYVKGGLENEPTEDILVAVKTVKPNVDVSYFIALLTELKVMGYVGTHANIACLLGACTTNIRNREVFVALEFCAKGDLLGYLKKHRESFVDLIQRRNKHSASIRKCQKLPKNVLSRTTSFGAAEPLPNASAEAESVSTMELVIWSQQIALGMDFVGSKNVIHGDLAARNVLLTADNVVKISDFGLSRQLHNYSTYVKTSKTPLPWKWMAIESLRDMTFSIHSDVWAFGVTLFEIFSLGTLPYPGRTWTLEFVDELVEGLRLNSPKYGNDDILHLMLDCMKLEPTERISFAEVAQKLEEIKHSILPMDANASYVLV